jgi:hypothetical protein
MTIVDSCSGILRFVFVVTEGCVVGRREISAEVTQKPFKANIENGFDRRLTRTELEGPSR